MASSSLGYRLENYCRITFPGAPFLETGHMSLLVYRAGLLGEGLGWRLGFFRP